MAKKQKRKSGLPKIKNRPNPPKMKKPTKTKAVKKPTTEDMSVQAKQELAVKEITRLLAENNLTLKINHEILIVPRNVK